MRYLSTPIEQMLRYLIFSNRSLYLSARKIAKQISFGVFFIFSFSLSYADSDVRLSWEKALVYYENNWLPRSPETAKPQNMLPTVIYLHGCTGIVDHAIRWASYLSENGYAVIMPDSFKRTGRISVCDPVTNKWDLSRFPEVDEYRLEEIRFALDKVKRLSWADQNRIYLMGHSEGGYAATRFPDLGFTGIVISGRQCGRTTRKRLFVRDSVPVLNLLFTKDPWYLGTWWEGSCKLHRNDVEEVVVEGVGHDTYYIDEMRAQVLKFFHKHHP